MSAETAHTPCRLIIDPPLDGAWLMAVDEALLESAAVSERCTLRFYRWSQPTLSLGYFQRHADRAMHAASRDCPLVRRQTGGGAILHDRELTYSLVVPQSHPLAADWARLYLLVHEALIAVLERSGVVAQICNQPTPATAAQPLLCFQRRAVGDVLIAQAKVCGSAQRRRRGAVLQHGSLLLAQSCQAPELPGIRELTGKSLAAAQLAEAAAAELAQRLRLDFLSPGLTASETDAATQLVSAKYRSPAWNQRR
jgi:lipoate-protein ligase A